MTLKRRLARLEQSRDPRQGSLRGIDSEVEELRRNCDDAQLVSRFDRATERFRLAMEEEAKLGSETDEYLDAVDEYLDALEGLDKFSREFTETQKRAEGGKRHGPTR